MGNDYITLFRLFTDESYFFQPLRKAWHKTFVNNVGSRHGTTRTSNESIRPTIAEICVGEEMCPSSQFYKNIVNFRRSILIVISNFINKGHLHTAGPSTW